VQRAVVRPEGSQGPGRKLTIEARAYNDGIAFRTIIPDQPAVKELRIANEKTEFVLASDATTYPLILRNFRSSWEDDYRTVPLSGIAPELVIGLPLLTEIPGVASSPLPKRTSTTTRACT
jgi:alpha-glucosidase